MVFIKPRAWALMGVVAVTAFVAGRRIPQLGDAPPQREQASFRGGRLTSPYLEATGAENDDASLVRVRRAVVDYVKRRQAVDPSLRVSVYLRDLDRGPWIGIDDRALYRPSSLTKLIVLVHALRREEEEPGLLAREVEFRGPQAMMGEDTMKDAPDSLRLEPGSAYSVRDLLERMIRYSDNWAFELVLEGVGSEGISRMLYDLSADQTVEDGVVYYDAHTVATLLRALYHSSFLSRRYSEYALDLLTQSRFRDGLRRALPPDAVVASKFGFYRSTGEGGTGQQLHECGVVYRPGAPYVLCVMTATDQSAPGVLEPVVGEISRIAWTR